LGPKEVLGEQERGHYKQVGEFTRLLLLADLVELKVEDMVRYLDGPSVMMGCYGISHWHQRL
jgi:hypothetical protein